MANCPGCLKSRPKHEEHLAREGYFECRATDNARDLMRAFNMFASERRSSIPFIVIGAPGHLNSVWPFQFQPEAIEQCTGFAEPANEVKER